MFQWRLKHTPNMLTCLCLRVQRSPFLLHGSRTVVPSLQACQMVVIQLEISRATSDTHCTLTWQPWQRSVSYICQPLSQGLKQLFCFTDVGRRCAEIQTYKMKWMHAFCVSGLVCVCEYDRWKAVGRERNSVSRRQCVCLVVCWLCAHLHEFWMKEEKKGKGLTHLASHWNELESSDSQLQIAACPLLGHKGLCYHRTHKQSLDVLLEWIAVVCITQLIKAERFKRRAEFFIPWYVLIALHCISCHRRWGRRQRSWGKLKRWAGGVSGTGLINVNITGRLISLCVSSPFLTEEEMEPQSLSLNLALVAILV